MSTFDFRDLVVQFDNSSVYTLERGTYTAPVFVHGVPQTQGQGGDANFTYAPIAGPFTFYPNPPRRAIERLPSGMRERADALLWTTDALVINSTDQGVSKADRVRDVAAGKTYAVVEQGQYAAMARVNVVILELIDPLS